MLRFRYQLSFLVVSLLLVLSVTLSGCGAALRSARRASHVRGELTMSVQVAPEANHNSPIAVDVLVVEDKDVLKLVSAMPASEWFEKRTDFERTHPNKIQLKSWEWVPGQVVDRVTVSGTGVANGVVLFANYLTKGDHRAVLPQGGRIAITFSADDFVIGQPR